MNVEVHLSIVDQISSKLRTQSDVEGVLLFGSVAEGKVTKRSDIDIMVMVKERRPYYRDCKFVEGIWLEQYFNTYENLKSTIERKELTHVYMFKDGKILHDPRGKMAELKQTATRIVEGYKVSEEDLEKERLQIQLLIDDLLDMYEMGDLDSAIFYMYDNQHIVLYKLFTMIDNRFLPKFKEIYSRFDELTVKPSNFNQLIRDVFFAFEPEKRLKSFLELANWTLQKLGGRLAEIKK